MSITFKSTDIDLKPLKFKSESKCLLKSAWDVIAENDVESVDSPDKKIYFSDYNSLYASIINSFNYHMPLIISPDIIWLQIVQQLGIHINQNSEKLRDKFVNFKGKKEIEVRRDYFVKGKMDNPWDNVFPEFSEKIKQHIGEKNHSKIISDFSTSTIISRSAQEVALMDCMKSYFKYKFTTMCGIPEITLEGNKEDWESILYKAKGLSEYDLSWWIDELVNVLQEFVNIWEGKINLDFWKDFVNKNEGSGGPFFCGHMLKLSAYKKDYRDVFQKIESYPTNRSFHGFTTSSFSSGVSKVPFVWNYYGQEFNMEFASGFAGMELIDGAYKPNISWAVYETK